MTYREIGNAVAEWDDTEPLVFTISETTGSGDDQRSKTIKISLINLRHGFEDAFLLNLKEHLIERRNLVSLRSIDTESGVLRSLFSKVINQKLFDSKVSIIDNSFLLCLGAVKQHLTAVDLQSLRQIFNANPHSSLFAVGLEASDFPLHDNKKGQLGVRIDSILAKALNQAAVVHILDLCDKAFAENAIDIGHYSFVHLAFAVFCRPNSYRQIRLSDLQFDLESNRYFLNIIPQKSRVHHPAKIAYQINDSLGVLLTKQRQNVIHTYGHLVDKEDIGKLALFPSRRLRENGTGWTQTYPNLNFGMHEGSDGFIRSYPRAIKNKFNDEHFTLSANALRHTLGTLLAQSGASARTIQAVLKHASPTVCNAYVDIAFYGLIKELSDAMLPAFRSTLPVFERFRSKNDQIPIERAIRSENLETGKVEQTGECGNNIACDSAPITCYCCFRFTPYWDADHSINLEIVQREIDDFCRRGKPFEHMVERARTAKNRIILVMNAADRYQDAMRPGSKL